MKQKIDIIYPELSYRLTGLFFKVHALLGCYRNEKQYADATEKIFKDNNIKYEREIPLEKSFDGEKARRSICDFIIDDMIIVDIKAKLAITKEDYYQMKRYLVSSGKRLGIIINFRQKHLVPKRVLN